MIGREPEEMLEQWEIGRAGKPLDFPNLVFMKLAVLVTARLGSRDRHRHLQDLTDLLKPYQDSVYEAEMDKAKNVRERIEHDGIAHVGPKEAVDVHQRMWLSALMEMMKRRGLLGETWIRG